MRKRGSYKVKVGTWTCPRCQYIHKPADLLRKDADNLICRGCGKTFEAKPDKAGEVP